MADNTINTSGGIFSHHFIESLRQDNLNHPALKAEAFSLPGKDRFTEKALETTIANAWELLVDRWDVIEREFGTLDISALRQRWLFPLFTHLNLNLEYQRADQVLEGDLRFPISHFGRAGVTETLVPVHTLLYREGNPMEQRLSSGRGIKNMAPHDMLQRYLNMQKEHNWAILCDGVFLRLLRDFHHTYTRGYVEFNLQSIFSTRDYKSFRAMYRLLHASRFILPPAAEDLPIDALYQDSLAMGVRVGEDLRKNVQAAIENLANGFLSSTPGLNDQLQQESDGAARLYRDILMIIYRMLFLLFAEQRGMLPGRGNLYMEEFSLTSLRGLAEEPFREDSSLDLWEKFKTSISLLEHGAAELGIYAYNGALFSLSRTPLLTPPNGDDAPVCRNDYFLQAVKHLTTVEKEHVIQRISYSDLSVEEIGSIYESLLEFTPRISENEIQINGKSIPARNFYLDPRSMGRKTSGSYYTPPSLVNELIKSALVPVLQDRLEKAVPNYDSERVEELSEEDRRAAAEALLKINVIDPAAGSGAFLIAANNRLALELARIRSGEVFPAESEIRKARRDVLANCIYAVDLNPMAVELCKVSLWINAAVEDAPLNFLDHHIKNGNSLVGASPDLTKEGIPDDAYNPLSGDDRSFASALKRQNSSELKGNVSFLRVFELETLEDLANFSQLNRLAEEDPHKAEETYYAWFESQDYWLKRLPYDLWTAAFFSPLKKGAQVPTTQDLRQARNAPRLLREELKNAIQRTALEHRFFHWFLEFPQVFDSEGKGGFDVVLGNPPWERVKLQEKEFFAGKDDQIAEASNAAARKRLIARLPQNNPVLWHKYQNALFSSEATSKFLRSSGAYPLTGRGDVNTYQVFAGKDRALTAPDGRAGFIVPTGIATDDTNKFYFADLIESNQLASLFDFENRNGIFPGVHRSYKFCLLTLQGAAFNQTRAADFAFFLLSTEELNDPEKVFQLNSDDFNLLNPNTKTCPIFRTRTDAALTRKLYQAAPVLINEQTGENPWGVSFQRMFDMSNDSELFYTREELEADGFDLVGDKFMDDRCLLVPLYEAKMFHQFDHRFGTYEGKDNWNDSHLNNINHQDPADIVLPRYWVDYSKTLDFVNRKENFLFAFRGIGRATDERTIISSLIPACGLGNSAPVINSEQIHNLEALFINNTFNSFIFDYISRIKIPGINLNFFIIKQLPVLKQNIFSKNIKKFIVPKTSELLFTSWDFQPIMYKVWEESNSEIKNLITQQWGKNAAATNGGHKNAKVPDWAEEPENSDFPFPPFKWDEKRRLQLRSELDALFGHLYNLTRDEFDYILETFPIVKRKDIDKYGEYRTKRLILQEFDRLAEDPMLEGVCVPLKERVSVIKHPQKEQPQAPQPKQPYSPPQTTVQKTAEPEIEIKPAEPKPQKAALQSKTPENQPAIFSEETDFSAKKSDYGLYRCQKCGKIILGYDKDKHTQDVHAGIDPGYKGL